MIKWLIWQKVTDLSHTAMEMALSRKIQSIFQSVFYKYKAIIYNRCFTCQYNKDNIHSHTISVPLISKIQVKCQWSQYAKWNNLPSFQWPPLKQERWKHYRQACSSDNSLLDGPLPGHQPFTDK